MKIKSLKTKLVLMVSLLVIGSGLILSLLEAHRFSRSLYHAAVNQGVYLSQALALEATNKILTNDLIALQNLLNVELKNNALLSYLFVVKDGQILAHTFTERGIPVKLIGVNAPRTGSRGRVKRLVNERHEHYLDIAWPIFSGKAGILRVGISERPYRSKMASLWMQLGALTLGILLLAMGVSFLFIKRATRPLSNLTEAVENLDADNLDLNLPAAGTDEIGCLTFSFNQMVERIRDYTGRLEKNALQLDRAHRQTKNAFEIIQKIWAKEDLKEACAYLILKFQEIVACQELVLFIFGSNHETLFVFAEGHMKHFQKQSFTPVLETLKRLDAFTFVAQKAFDDRLVPDVFHAATHVATFPFQHENQLLGALLTPCPGNCRCDTKELNVISLIMNHAAPAIKRAVLREEKIQNILTNSDAATEYCGIVGKDAKMKAVYKLIEDIAPGDTTVLIQGESGTGKELVARAIYQKSLRKEKPFVVINCSAYPATLLESELFGHEKGAFTGALRRKAGRFELADSGTVFLDEIGEIPLSAQIRLLRVLQTQRFERLGGEETLEVNVRILAATNKDLFQEVQAGRFREDLFYRLNVIPIHLPPLRKRPNDIPLQVRHFMQKFSAQQGKEIREISPDVMRRLMVYPWPGNVRELENCIEHAVVLAKNGRIELPDLPLALQQKDFSDTPVPHGTITEHEARLLREMLDACNWNKKQAAARLGISRNTLYRKLKKYRINAPTVH